MLTSLWLIPALPLAGFLFNLFLGPRLPRKLVGVVACGVVGAAFLVAASGFVALLGRPPADRTVVDTVWSWITVGDFHVDVSFLLDPLSCLMALVVTGVGFLIHVYSTGYMSDDEGYKRYFLYLNLFTFSMLTLVLGSNFLVMFVGWEGVGLCSYLLIGFWYTKQSATDAGKKAFIVNRIGDFGFLLGMMFLFWTTGSLDYKQVFAAAPMALPYNTFAPACACLFLFLGAVGKSAQIPLYVWLPDAMEGPTPVSALIHAATMVTAGVYMVARCHVLFELSPLAMEVVAVTGAATALFAASIGLVQTDIKRVLAYSTVSQLGYMFLACGVGAFTAGIFHLMTHAFFKGLLFLGAGSVIHGMSGEQDIRKMGGLREKMPITFWTFAVACCAIAGVPLFSGFFSKDAILFHAFTNPEGHPALWAMGLGGAILTAFYMFRLLFLTFFGACRSDHHTAEHVHESPPSMTIPLLVLAVLSVVGGYVGLPEGWAWGDRFSEFLAPVLSHPAAGRAAEESSLEGPLMLCSVVAAFSGIALAYLFYLRSPAMPENLARRFRAVYETLLNKYWVDEIYGATVVAGTIALANGFWKLVDVLVIDGIVNGVGNFVRAQSAIWRRIQTGNVQHYALTFLVGVIVVVGYFLFR